MKKIRSKLGVSALVLLVSGVVCKVLGALFRLPLTNLLGIEGIGIFQLVMSLYAFALVVTCGGVTSSLSKLISSARARGEQSRVSSYLKHALFVSVGLGLLIGLVFLVFSSYISAFQGIDASYSYMIFIFLLPLGAGLSALRGVFQGHENMVPTAVSQIIEQVAKFGFGLLFAFYFSKLGVSQGVFGAFLGILSSEIVAIIYLFVLFFFKNKNIQRVKDLKSVKFARQEFNKANFPLMLSASVLPLVNAFDSLIIVPRLMLAGFENSVATQLYGLQAGVVGAILNFPLVISIAVTTTLLPNISYLISRGLGGRHIIERGLKILLFLILPTTFGLVAISRQVLALVYQDLTKDLLNIAFLLMLYGGFSTIFTALMQYLTMLLQANGHFRFIFLITAIGGIFKALFSYLFSALPSVNIFALVLGNIALSAVVCVVALWKLKRIINFTIPFFDLFLVILGTFAMFLTVYTFVACNYFHVVVNLILAVILGAVVYLVITAPYILRIKVVSKRRRTA